MEWAKKVEMVQLANSGPISEFHQFVLSNINEFDIQAWDIFITIICVVPDEVNTYKAFYLQILPHIESAICQEINCLTLSARLKLLVLAECIADCKQGESNEL